MINWGTLRSKLRSLPRLQLISWLTIVVLVCLALPVTAQNDQSGAGSGLRISPTRFELIIEPGAAESVTVQLKNISGADIVAKALVNDFEADNVTGAPRYLDPSIQTPRSIRNFLKNLQDVPLAKDETKNVRLDFEVPANATPGAYYGVVRYEAVLAADSELDPGSVSLTASTGPIVLIQVPGNLTESMRLERLKLELDGRSGKVFIRPPTHAVLEVKNTGNSFLKPFGRVTILDGEKELYSYEINAAEPRGNVLPDSSRIFKDEVKNIGKFGHFKANASIGFSQGGEVLTIQTDFWVVPWWVIVLVLLALLLLGVAVFFVGRKLKRRGFRRRY